MTTSPDGEPVLFDRRLGEIHDPYGPGHPVSRSIQRATPMILCAVMQGQDSAAGSHSSADRDMATPNDLGLGWDRVHLAPGMAPGTCSISSNYFSELEPRYGIEP